MDASPASPYGIGTSHRAVTFPYGQILFCAHIIRRNMDDLSARLEKQIPALRLQIAQLYSEFDRKFHLHGAGVPVTFGMDRDVLGSYTPAGGSEEEHFHFSLLYTASYGERPVSNEDRLDIFRHEYAHYMQYNMPIPAEYNWQGGKHGSAWKYCCSLTGAVPTPYYRAGEALQKQDYEKALRNPWKGTSVQLLDTVHREAEYQRKRNSQVLYREGETVKHPKFGEGVIREVTPKDGSVILHIQFRDQLRKIDQKWLNRTRYRSAR